jgi:hypothetical protein
MTHPEIKEGRRDSGNQVKGEKGPGVNGIVEPTNLDSTFRFGGSHELFRMASS